MYQLRLSRCRSGHCRTYEPDPDRASTNPSEMSSRTTSTATGPTPVLGRQAGGGWAASRRLDRAWLGLAWNGETERSEGGKTFAQLS